MSNFLTLVSAILDVDSWGQLGHFYKGLCVGSVNNNVSRIRIHSTYLRHNAQVPHKLSKSSRHDIGIYVYLMILSMHSFARIKFQILSNNRHAGAVRSHRSRLSRAMRFTKPLTSFILLLLHSSLLPYQHHESPTTPSPWNIEYHDCSFKERQQTHSPCSKNRRMDNAASNFNLQLISLRCVYRPAPQTFEQGNWCSLSQQSRCPC